MAKNNVIEACIEITQGSQNKYEVNEEGQLKLDRVLFSSQVYPTNYGYVKKTLGEDGDPLDVLVISSCPILPTALVDVRVLGYLNLIDSGENDQKLVGVVDADPRFDHVQSFDDINPHTIKEITNFFDTYKILQNKETQVLGYGTEQEALDLLEDAKQRFVK